MPVTSKSSRLPETLILPVETLNREFDAKLHLALRAAARGWKVILGGRTAIHSRLPSLPRSVYLAKGIRTGNRRILRLLNSFGHVIVALDEEALIRYTDEALLMMLDEETFNRPRLLFAWGKSNADVWRRFKGYHGSPILEVGNPRVDLLRTELAGFYAGEVRSFHERYGRFVLLSSNFSMVNHYIPDFVRFKTAKGTDSKRRDELKDGIRAHKARIFQSFRDMVPRLAGAIAPVSLVIRPHPSENQAAWVEAFGGLDNVHVIHEGPMAPWIMAADALIHNGCTSAVEAAIAGTAAFAYKPFLSAEFDIDLPDKLSHQCSDEEGLISEVVSSLRSGARPQSKLNAAQQAMLRENIASVDGSLSAERILDSLEHHPAMHAAINPPSLTNVMAGLTSHYKRRAVRAVTTRLPRSASSATYTAHKFPGITSEMIDSRIERFHSVIPELPRFRHRQVATDIHRIERMEPSHD